MIFSQLLASARRENDALLLDVPSDWMQGRSAFGGLQAAFAVQAMRLLEPDAPLRTLQATFVAPVSGSMRVRAQLLRRGKNTAHVEARIGDDSATHSLFVGVFGTPRRSAVARVIAEPAFEVDPSRVFEKKFGDRAALTNTSFTRHFQVRWLRGKPPFMGDPETQHVLEIAIDDEGSGSEAHLIAIADFIPPIAFSQLETPATGSTLTWMLELLSDRLRELPLQGYHVHAELVAARDGYTDQSLTVFSPSGEALALGRQSMLVFG